jgi:hypothetical protein
MLLTTAKREAESSSAVGGTLDGGEFAEASSSIKRASSRKSERGELRVLFARN